MSSHLTDIGAMRPCQLPAHITAPACIGRVMANLRRSLEVEVDYVIVGNWVIIFASIEGLNVHVPLAMFMGERYVLIDDAWRSEVVKALPKSDGGGCA